MTDNSSLNSNLNPWCACVCGQGSKVMSYVMWTVDLSQHYIHVDSVMTGQRYFKRIASFINNDDQLIWYNQSISHNLNLNHFGIILHHGGWESSRYEDHMTRIYMRNTLHFSGGCLLVVKFLIFFSSSLSIFLSKL